MHNTEEAEWHYPYEFAVYLMILVWVVLFRATLDMLIFVLLGLCFGVLFEKD